MPKVIINNFSGGISEDKRSTNATKFSLTKHFDTFTYPHKLVPYYPFVAFDAASKAKKITNFVYAPRDATDTTFRLFGIGVKNGGTTELGVYFIDPGVDTTWQTSTNSEGANTGAYNNAFAFYYKGYIYTTSGFTSSSVRMTYLARFDVTGSGAFGSTYQTINAYDVADPVHHPADDIAYFFVDNLVHKLDNTSWSGSVLTLPSNLVIKSACAYGNYLAIGTTTKGTFNQKTVVYLWDRDSSLNTVSEKIDFGEGTLVSLHNLDGKLIAVMNYYANNALSNLQPKIIIKESNGVFGVPLVEFVGDALSGSSIVNTVSKGVLKNGKIYFPACLNLDGDTRFGVWAVDSIGRFTQALNIPNSYAGASKSIQSIYPVANAWWVAHSADGSVDANYLNTNTYPDTSTYESLILNGGDSDQDKKLVRVSVMTEPMPATGQIVLKYRKNEETAWTTIYTDTTANSISHTAINIESSGANLPEYQEIQFQILSTGGAVVTGLKVEWENIETGI